MYFKNNQFWNAQGFKIFYYLVVCITSFMKCKTMQYIVHLNGIKMCIYCVYQVHHSL